MKSSYKLFESQESNTVALVGTSKVQFSALNKAGKIATLAALPSAITLGKAVLTGALLVFPRPTTRSAQLHLVATRSSSKKELS